MAVQLGMRLGPYEVLGPLGAGGMGEVWRARDTRLDRTVAIKVLPEGFAADPERRTRFEREARAASALNHPHICTLHDIGHHEGVDYIVLEHLEGETLVDRLTSGPLPLDGVLRYGIEIAEALAAAHRAGILHRDLKPGNVMLTKRGAKLLDFGLAKRAGVERGAALSVMQTATAAKPLTSAGTVMGTIQYMSPEQLEGKEADARSDIWALGTLLYEMATGKRAFTGASQASIVAAILKEDPRPMRELQPIAPPALDRLVRACLAKDPEERMESAGDVARELAWMREGPEALTSAPPTSRRGRLAWVIAALLMGALAGVWVGRHWSPKGSASPRETSGPVTRTTIELPASAPLGIGTAAVGFDGTLLALSPDGKWLVYVGVSNGVTKLYRRALDRFDEPQPIAGTDGAIHAFFSPDSRFVGFLTDDKVKRVSLEGDDLRTLCDAAYPVQGNWTQKDAIFFADSLGFALRSVPAKGGRAERLASDASRDRLIFFGDVLPDGRAVFVSELTRSVSSDYGAILILDVASGKSRVIVESGSDPRYVPPNHLLFARGGNVMAVAFDPDRLEVTGEPVPVLRGVAMNSLWPHAQFAVSATGSLAYVPGGDRAVGRLARVDRQGHEEMLPAAPGHYNTLELSPDGTRLAVHVADVTDFVWIWDLKRNEGRRLTESAPAGWPVWSPAGDLVAFSSRLVGSPGFALQVQRVEGGESPRTLFQGRGEGYINSWAGTKLAIMDGIGTDRWRSGIVSTTTTPSVEWDDTLCMLGVLSPDGRWIACGGAGQIELRSLTNRAVVRQISTDGGIEPSWCRTCNQLFFRKGSRWFATSVSFAPELRWDPPRMVFETDFLDTRGMSYAVSPDGQFLYVVKPATQDERRKLHFVSGFLQELERLVPTAPGT